MDGEEKDYSIEAAIVQPIERLINRHPGKVAGISFVIALLVVFVLDPSRKPEKPDEPTPAKPTPTLLKKPDRTVDGRESLENNIKFERAARDRLYQAILSDERSFSVLGRFKSLLRTYFLFGRTSPYTRRNVGPRTYLFDHAPGSPHISDGTYGYYDLSAKTVEATIKEAPLEVYRDEIRSLPEKFREEFLEPDLAPFYNSVRNPTDEDLQKLYEFLHKIPEFILDAFLKSTEKDFEIAMAIIAENPELCAGRDRFFGKSVFTAEECSRWEENPRVVHYTRRSSGELRFEDRTGLGPLVFKDSRYAKTPPFAKWLFRRGERFTKNAQVLLNHNYN